ncbi:hypothetical protein LSG31_07325 [Fodinisporobacter ferrooxydans]|uniref:Glycine zipper domain-containing protein n=1 Tax=Fodinisporobacter ferrooxydans TaxID=2901836 RepID=A0ABY4CNY0_9BACL|nr:hypothetical protein LSG31_07325 [Alicyclobacillaceae bacterium MYW30-H2]
MFRGASLWTGLIAGGLYQFEDAKSYNNGEIKKNDYAAKTTTNVVSAVGIMAGVEYGAIWGTALMPGIGTVVGSVVGAVVGDRLGQYVGGQAGNMMFNRNRNGQSPLMAPNGMEQNQAGQTSIIQ